MTYNTVGDWYNSFLNRAPTAEEHQYWSNQLAQGGDGALDQFLATAQKERPLDSLTDHQRKVYEDAANAYKTPNVDNTLNAILGGKQPTSFDDIKDSLYDNITDLDNNRDAFNAKWKQVWDSGGTDALKKALQGESQHTALLEMQAANRKPNGSDNSFLSFLKEGLPIVAMPFVAGAAVNGLGALGAAGGSTAAGSGATAAGGAAAGAGGLGGVTGGLGSAWAALPTAAQSALTSMGIKGGMNLVTGQPLTSGLLQAALMSGAGSIGSSFIGPTLGDGLSNLGFSKDTVASLVKPLTTGIIGTGTGLIKGQSLGQALLNGMQSGTISYAGDQLNGFLKDSGLSQPAQNVLGGAGKGALGSVIRGKNPLSGIVSGATTGAFNYGAGLLNSNDTTSPQKVNMSGTNDDDPYSFDGTDYLKQIESDYSDPYGFRNSDFTNYGNDNYQPYTMNDSYEDTFPDLMNYQADDPNTGNSALDSFLKQLGGGLGTAAGNAVAGGSSNSFIDKLMKQVGGLGDKAGQNPLAAIAAALGAAGTLRNVISGTPNNLGAVDDLMAKGRQQMNTPATMPIGNIVARDPRMFTQHYDANNNPVASNAGSDVHNQLNTLYQSVLGRAPDAAGEQYWAQQMQNGMPIQQVLQYMQNSPEHNPQAQQVMTGALSKVNQ